MNTTIGASQTSLAIVNTAISGNALYFTKFVSEALSGVSSITSGTNNWTYNFAAKESGANSNFPVNSSGTARMVIYVWRPSSQTKLGNIMDTNSTINTAEGTANTEVSHNVTGNGVTVSSVQDGDVICCEIWFANGQLSQPNTDTFYFDGTTATTTDNTTVSNHASFIETTQTLTFAAAGGPVDCTVTGKTIYNKTTTHG